MSKNPVVPFAIIAVIGIISVIIISYVGDSQRTAILNPDANDETVEIGAPEDIYANSCVSCHGDDLSGLSAPGLTQVGSSLSQDEIEDIIINGTDAGMPGGLTSVEEAQVLAEWLAEMK